MLIGFFSFLSLYRKWWKKGFNFNHRVHILIFWRHVRLFDIWNAKRSNSMNAFAVRVRAWAVWLRENNDILRIWIKFGWKSRKTIRTMCHSNALMWHICTNLSLQNNHKWAQIPRINYLISFAVWFRFSVFTSIPLAYRDWFPQLWNWFYHKYCSSNNYSCANHTYIIYNTPS